MVMHSTFYVQGQLRILSCGEYSDWLDISARFPVSYVNLRCVDKLAAFIDENREHSVNVLDPTGEKLWLRRPK